MDTRLYGREQFVFASEEEADDRKKIAIRRTKKGTKTAEDRTLKKCIPLSSTYLAIASTYTLCCWWKSVSFDVRWLRFKTLDLSYFRVSDGAGKRSAKHWRRTTDDEEPLAQFEKIAVKQVVWIDSKSGSTWHWSVSFFFPPESRPSGTWLCAKTFNDFWIFSRALFPNLTVLLFTSNPSSEDNINFKIWLTGQMII